METIKTLLLQRKDENNVSGKSQGEILDLILCFCDRWMVPTSWRIIYRRLACRNVRHFCFIAAVVDKVSTGFSDEPLRKKWPTSEFHKMWKFLKNWTTIICRELLKEIYQKYWKFFTYFNAQVEEDQRLNLRTLVE